MGRGDAYAGSGETEENLAAALADYEKAVELDEILTDVYLKMAEVYQKQGDEETAKQILQQGFDITSDEELQRQIGELTKLKPKEGYPKTERWDYESGEKYEVTEYDEYGQQISSTIYYADDTIDMRNIYKYDEWGNQIYLKHYSAVTYLSYANPSYTYERYFDKFGRIIKESEWRAIGETHVTYDYVDCPTVVISAHVYDTERSVNDDITVTYQMQNPKDYMNWVGLGKVGDVPYCVIEENASDGRSVRNTCYWLDGSIREYTVYTWVDDKVQSKRYDANGNQLP